jgi:hypothetical protein
MSDKYEWRVALESATGFVLDTDLLDTGLLGFLTTELDDPRVKIRSVDVQGGRNRELDRLPPGTARIVFDNREGLFSPGELSSPYYQSIFPGKLISLSYVSKLPGIYQNLSFLLFSGIVTDWSFDFDLNGDATATVSAKDYLGFLADVSIPSTAVPEETTGKRFERICLLAGLNSQLISYDTGYSTLAAGTIEGNALSLVDEVVFQEQGFLYVSNYIGFRSRNSDQRVPEFVFSDTRNNSSSIPYTSFNTFFSNDSIQNQVTTTSALGTATATNASSVTQYGSFSTSYETLFSNLLQQENFGRYLATTYGVPQYRPDGVTISVDDLLTFPNVFNGSNAYDGFWGVYVTALAAYGAVCTVEFDSPGSGYGFGETLVVSSWAYSSTPGSYTLTVGFESAVFLNTFILDDLTSGILDNNELAF